MEFYAQLTGLPGGGVILQNGNRDGPDGEQLAYRWDGSRWSVAATGDYLRYSTLVLDQAEQLVYRFGGRTQTGEYSNDLWVLEGQQWQLVAVNGTRPSGRQRAAMFYDSCDGALILHGGEIGTEGLTDTWKWSEEAGWILLGNNGPLLRSASSLAWDESRCIAVAVVPRTTYTWVWQQSGWTLADTGGPRWSGSSSPEYDVPVYYDPNAEAVVAVDDVGATWAWGGIAWQQIQPPTLGGLWGKWAAYDSQRQVAVMFGGVTTSELGSDQWIQRHKTLAGTSTLVREVARAWEDSAPYALSTHRTLVQKQSHGWGVVAHHPAGVETIAFDAGRGALLAFSPDAVYRFEQESWVVEGSLIDGPGERDGIATVYDHQAQAVLLVGGTADGGSSARDTWAWDGASWTLLDAGPPTGGDSPRYLHTDWDTLRSVGVFQDEDGQTAGVFIWSGESWESLDETRPPFSAARLAWDWSRDTAIALEDGSDAQWLWTQACGWELASNPIEDFYDRYLCEYDVVSDTLILGRADRVGILDSACDDNDCCWSVVRQPQSVEVRRGDSVVLSIDSSRVGPLAYQWFKDGVSLVDDGRTTGSQTRELRIASVTHLDQGQYLVALQSTCRSETSDAATVEVTCSADLSEDGAVDTRDFILYLGLWAVGDAGADWDGNSVVDTRDFMAYLNDWSAGC